MNSVKQTNNKKPLKQLNSVCNKFPTDRAMVHFLSTFPAELVSTEEGGVPGLCQANGTVRTTTVC